MQASQSAFGQGGMNELVDPEALLEEIGLDRREIEWVAATEEQSAKVQEIESSVNGLASETSSEPR